MIVENNNNIIIFVQILLSEIQLLLPEGELADIKQLHIARKFEKKKLFSRKIFRVNYQLIIVITQ